MRDRRIESVNPSQIRTLNGNPLDDIEVMENVSFVMRGGTVYRAP